MNGCSRFPQAHLEFPSGGERSRPNSLGVCHLIAEHRKSKLDYYTERWFCGERLARSTPRPCQNGPEGVKIEYIPKNLSKPFGTHICNSQLHEGNVRQPTSWFELGILPEISPKTMPKTSPTNFTTMFFLAHESLPIFFCHGPGNLAKTVLHSPENLPKTNFRGPDNLPNTFHRGPENLPNFW